MKWKVIFVVSLTVAFIAGYYAGAYRERVAYDHFFMGSVYLHAAGDTQSYVGLLRFLREGRTNEAMSRLDTLLDSSLATLSDYDKAPPSEQDKFVIPAVRSAQDYRKEYPRSSVATNADTRAVPPNTALEPTPTAP